MVNKHVLLRDHVAALREVEARIQSQVQDTLPIFHDYPEVHALLSAAADGAGQHHAALSEYLGGADGRADHHNDATFVHDPTQAPATILNRHIADFGNAVTAYTVLTELAFRFYDPAPSRARPETSQSVHVAFLCGASSRACCCCTRVGGAGPLLSVCLSDVRPRRMRVHHGR